MPRKSRNYGFTLVEMLVVIAIIAILVAIVLFLLLRSRNRANAATNAANLRMAEGVLTLALLDDPDSLPGILATAPTAAGINLPGFTLTPGTQMDAVVSGSGVNTQFGPFDKEDFADLAEDGAYDGTTTESTAPTQATQVCQMLLRDGDTLVPCGNLYQGQCGNHHYIWAPCGCSINHSSSKACRCGHWHSGAVCTDLKIVEDNRPN